MKQYSLLGTKTFDEILENIAELNPDKQIDLMEDYVPCHPHVNIYDLLQLKKQINSFGLSINSSWYYTDLVGATSVNGFENVVKDLTEFIITVATLDAKFISIPLGGSVPGMKFEEGKELFSNIFEKIIPIAEENNVNIALESARTYGYPSPKFTLDLVKSIASDVLTVTPDFEAWRFQSDDLPSYHVESPGFETSDTLPIELFEECLPYAPFIHAKFISFDNNGEEPNFPIAEMMSAIKRSSREHVLSVEYEGWIPEINPDLDSMTETRKGVDLLKRYLN